MSSVIETIERAQLRRVPDFAPGDRVKVHFQVIEGARRRVQVFEGVVIKRQGHGARETFTVRKQSFGVGVERMFPLHSPKIERIELAARGDVRRAKLYYLRDRVGKRARVRERRYAGPEDRRRAGSAGAGGAGRAGGRRGQRWCGRGGGGRRERQWSTPTAAATAEPARGRSQAQADGERGYAASADATAADTPPMPATPREALPPAMTRRDAQRQDRQGREPEPAARRQAFGAQRRSKQPRWL